MRLWMDRSHRTQHDHHGGMPRSVPIPPELGPAFSVRAAQTQGLRRGRLAGSDLRRPFRGSRALPIAEPSLSDSAAAYFEHRRDLLVRKCLAYSAVASPGFAFSHATAAEILGIPLPVGTAGWPIHVSVPKGTTPPRMRGVIGHTKTEQCAVIHVRGLPVLRPEAVWLQLAATLCVDDLIVAGDHLVRRKRAQSGVAALEAAIAAAAGSRGIRKARAAIPDIRPGTDSPMESKLRLALVRAGLPEPVIGHTVLFEGAFVGTPDLAYVREKIALDYEGEVHRNDESVFANDIERRENFADAHWRHVRVTKEQIPHRIVARVRNLLAERAVAPD